MAAPQALLSAELVLELARRYAPAAKEVTEVIESGFDHVVYCVDDSVILKVPRPGEHPILLQREALILNEIAGMEDLPVPKLIGSEVGRDVANPHVCMALVEGRQLESIPELDEGKRRSLLQEVGQALAVLHKQAVEPFLRSGIFEVATTYRQYLGESLRRSWEVGVRRFIEQGLLSTKDNESLESVYEKGAKAFPDWARLVLLHNDIRPAHVIVDTDTDALGAQ